MDFSTILEYGRNISAAVVLAGVLYAIYLWANGIAPALMRLGNGLAKRKICIFAKGEMLESLRSLLYDSTLVKEKNIVGVNTSSDIGKCESTTLFLVSWSDWSPEEFAEILKRKNDGTAFIVYAPQDRGFIPAESMKLLNNHRNVMVSNFRGRLLNDVVTSMITTSYEKD